MTTNTTPNSEPTLSDIIQQIEELSDEVKKSNERFVDEMKGYNERFADEMKGYNERFADEMKGYNERFAEYRQATQWVVQLAFALITSATITVIITSVFK